MHSTNQTTAAPQIIDYGIAYANDFFTLSALVKNQIKKGFQPCIASGVKSMQHGEHTCFVQVMVKYEKPLTKKKAPCRTKRL